MNFIEKQMEATVFHLNQISLIDSDLAESGSVFFKNWTTDFRQRSFLYGL